MKSLTEHISSIEARVAAKKAAGETKPPADAGIIQQARQLPLWPELERAIPNPLARSCLFSPIAPGRRKRHDRSEIASRDDVKIFFTGTQLDMADCDVFMQALYEAHRAPLGERVIIKRGAFLKAIGRSTGRSDYEWLHESFRRLFLAAIEIETKKFKIGGSPKSSGLHLIDAFDYDPDHDVYFIRFDPRILTLFFNREYALIDWDKRKQLQKRVDMAKWVQNYLASHERGPHRVSLKLLKQWMDYSSPMNKFKEALGEALGELERLQIIAGNRFEMSTRREMQAIWEKL